MECIAALFLENNARNMCIPSRFVYLKRLFQAGQAISLLAALKGQSNAFS